MLAGLLVLLLQTPPSPAAPAPQTPAVAGPAEPVIIVSYVPERVYDARRKRFSDFEAMLASVAGADVVIVGEQHDDRNTHRLELAMLEGLMRRRSPIVVSLEMFERDVQGALSEYLAGTRDEESFLKASRPWPRYASDYRPLVEFAKAHGWRVIASNVPRRLAAVVAKEGLDALETLGPEDRALGAASIECPRDDYRKRFLRQMNEHPAPGSEDLSRAERETRDERYYLSQCLKDETMAEAIVSSRGPDRPLVVHFNGAFHSDFGAGVAARVKRRLKGARVAVVTIVPVDDLDRLNPSGAERRRADYLVYTLKPRPSPHATRP
jgi:uncharacterized iron-regulated protein